MSQAGSSNVNTRWGVDGVNLPSPTGLSQSWLLSIYQLC